MSNSTSGSYFCPVCDETFQTPYQRGGHFRTHHFRAAKRESLLEKLRQIADEKGTDPALNDIEDCKWASPSSFKSVFDSWQAAVEAAGYEPAKRQNIPENELLAELERVATRLSDSPTKKEFDEHGQFCSATYVNRFGTWNDALELVDLQPSRNFDIPTESLKTELLRVGEKLGKPPSVAEARELAEYSVSTYEREFGTWNEALAAVGYEVNQHKTVSNEDLIRNLQELASDLGSPPTVVENRRHGEYSLNAYQNNFGSWNEALSVAGLERNSKHDIPRNDLLQEIHRLKDDLGHPPILAELKSHGQYSHIPYVNKFGSWSNALQEAGLTPWETRRLKPHPIYSVGWTEKLRERIRTRDGRKCMSCGLSEKTSIERYGRRLTVHHICGARTSENPAVFNAPRNLISVCLSCHTEMEEHTPGLPPHIDQPGQFPD